MTIASFQPKSVPLEFVELIMISFQRLCRKTMMCLGNTLPNSSTRQAHRRWISSDAMGTYSCQVIISKASCIYDNLALEDWLYEKTGSELNQRRLLMWRSSPCVVIGKFQNQWQECNYHALGEHRVKLGRPTDIIFSDIMKRTNQLLS